MSFIFIVPGPSPLAFVSCDARSVYRIMCKNVIKLSLSLSCLVFATDRNIIGRNMLYSFGHPVATSCDMLRVEN